MSETSVPIAGMHLDVPGRPALVLTDLLIDFSGTLAFDGTLLPSVGEALVAVATKVRITVATADTFNRAREALQGLPLAIQLVETGADKVRIAEALGLDRLVAIGNGLNDVPMLEAAALGIAVIGPEGASAELIRVADVVTTDIRTALDLLQHPLRLTASLRP